MSIYIVPMYIIHLYPDLARSLVEFLFAMAYLAIPHQSTPGLTLCYDVLWWPKQATGNRCFVAICHAQAHFWACCSSVKEIVPLIPVISCFCACQPYLLVQPTKAAKTDGDFSALAPSFSTCKWR